MDRRPQRGRRRHAPGRVRRRRGPAGRVAGCDRGCHPGHRSPERQHSAPRRDACNQGRRRQSRRGPAAPAVDRDSLPSRERRPQRRRPRPGGRCLRPAGRGRSPDPWRSGRGRALPRGWRLVFARLAEAEAQAHGVRVEDVRFHEVGAWDSIADVIGVAAALQALGVRSVTAGPVALGSGTIRTAHAQMPIPVPAVLELSAGWRVFSGGAGELATPTGMAVVVALADACDELPELDVTAVGVGAGTREDERRPNVVRVVIGTLPVSPATSDAVVLEANVDDLDPRVWPSVLAALLEAGADDAWLIPTLAKKGRPAHTLAVLAAPERMPELRARVFALVPTLGVRETRVRKTALERAWRTVEFDGVSVRVKLAHIRGEIVTATPEFEDVALVAAATI